ncbi:hypothetical protein niasHS_014190 [Heterodera schachtii]|uniref:Uncharacterized protein n=2 Tax=Heterodera TaxID=34509 RepID=A0ABD2IBZ4_HETSC
MLRNLRFLRNKVWGQLNAKIGHGVRPALMTMMMMCTNSHPNGEPQILLLHPFLPSISFPHSAGLTPTNQPPAASRGSSTIMRMRECGMGGEPGGPRSVVERV